MPDLMIPLDAVDRLLVLWGAVFGLPCYAAIARAVWRVGFAGPAFTRRELVWWVAGTVVVWAVALAGASHAVGMR